ncbi:MAG: NAD(P)/FAD-dependent oxidoreductase [Candidatus Zixiibacteriota bacterium]|nr:MAG: NAD(P)/FAD-dependent oxidoreductase [candidate division Zixibacteria bacterium]
MRNKRILVVGGGPAGLMAAGQAALSGARVIVLEKKSKPLRKLGITGKGRCNLTNKAPLTEFIKRFGSNGRFLRSAFDHFYSDDLIRFLKKLGVETAFERGGRVFPLSGDAGEVADALLKWARGNGVKIRTGIRVKGLIINENNIAGVKYVNLQKSETAGEYIADKVIIATGGASYPATGSTGDGYRLAESAGHRIIPIRPALVPLETRGDVAKRLQGLSLKNIGLKVMADDKKVGDIFGEMLFTHYGVSGPIILTISKIVVDLLRKKQRVFISIDLKPALDEKKLDIRLLRDLNSHGNKKFRSILKLLLPQKLIPVCVELTGIPGEKLCHQVSSAERKKLRLWLKDFRLDITGHRSFNEAIITAGGVCLKEVNPKTLESRLVKNLYFAGEVLDIDADTGGFNLQAAFSTGCLAGASGAEKST